MTLFPENPFKPGAGRTPAYMGRRPEVESILSGFLKVLKAARPDLELGFLYGPRGNGKTVLLRWLEDEAAAANIATVALVPEHLESSAGLAGAVRTAMRRFPMLGKWLSTVETDVGGVKVGFASGGSIPLLADLLDQGEDRLLLTLDEAHEAPPDMLGRFLNAAQLAGRSRPIAVVFAGTPGLEAALLETHASFWNRGVQLCVGLLEDGSAREAMARPFRDAGLEADNGAIADLTTAADNYPYFLQLYGEAAWRVAEASGGRAFLPEHVTPTLKSASGRRQAYYRNRYQEFLKADLLPLARRVAEAFVASAEAPADRCLTNTALTGLLAYEGGYDHRMFLVSKGYVWQDSPETLSWTPGIPSLMDYMIENIPAA